MPDRLSSCFIVTPPSEKARQVATHRAERFKEDAAAVVAESWMCRPSRIAPTEVIEPKQGEADKRDRPIEGIVAIRLSRLAPWTVSEGPTHTLRF